MLLESCSTSVSETEEALYRIKVTPTTLQTQEHYFNLNGRGGREVAQLVKALDW